MSKWKSALALRPAQWALLWEAAIALAVAKSQVLLLSQRRLAELLVQMMVEGDDQVASGGSADMAFSGNVAREIARVVRNSPIELACLPQALAAYRMLGRRGIGSQVRLGAPLDCNGAREMHAWLKVGDTWVTGHCNEKRYARFLPSQITHIAPSAFD